MTDFFGEAFNALSVDEFDEIPVEIEEFVTSHDFLNLPPLSPVQYDIIRAGSQIYRYDTLVNLYGEEKASERWRQTFNEIILQLGKGSGKDYTSTIVCAYIVYLLLCLKSPARYFGTPEGDNIDIVNIAVNADQANNVFFKNFVKRIKNCPWFEGKYYEKKAPPSIEFDKSVNVYSGHSEREAFEGLNLLVGVLDEISAFALQSNTGNTLANTAEATYNMYRDSVDSRFAEFGKIIMLSFPRFENDYIQQKYDEAVAEKEVITRNHTFKLDADLPDDTEGNEFSIEWEEDHIIRYKRPGVYALRRASWEVNPIKNIEMYKWSFHRNPGNALGKFACCPSGLDEGFFKNMDAIDLAFSRTNGVDNDGIFRSDFLPQLDTKYFIHVDLAQKHDYCAVGMAHVDHWVQVSVGADYKEIHPYVVVDALRWWTPTAEKTVDFADVRDYIISLRRRGFDIQLTTFDRWNSHDTMNILENSHGIRTDTLSVDKKHYDDFLSVLYDNRLSGPNEELLKKELGELRTVRKGQKIIIDHPRKGSKDLSDATCGAIYSAIEGTPKRESTEVEVLTSTDVRRLAVEENRLAQQRKAEQSGLITPPPRYDAEAMPDTLEAYLQGIKVL